MKLIEVANSISNIALPHFASEEGKAVAKRVTISLNDLAKYIKDRAKTL